MEHSNGVRVVNSERDPVSDVRALGTTDNFRIHALRNQDHPKASFGAFLDEPLNSRLEAWQQPISRFQGSVHGFHGSDKARIFFEDDDQGREIAVGGNLVDAKGQQSRNAVVHFGYCSFERSDMTGKIGRARGSEFATGMVFPGA